MTTSRDFIELSLNGHTHQIRQKQAFSMVADFLRYEQGLTGTKIVCAEGDCGACTVLVRNPHEPDFYPINACITSVFQLDRCEILTVEGLTRNEELTHIQQSIMNAHASQCGFCTPGFVMAMSAYFEKPRPNRCPQSIKNALTGNLCRCTGYQPFIDAAMKVDNTETLSSRPRPVESFKPASVHIETADKEVFLPATIDDALSYLSSHKSPRIWSGSTDLGVQHNKGKLHPKHILSLKHIDSLRIINETNGQIEVKSLVTIEQTRRFLKSRIKPVADFLNIFASPQIKHQATLVGNIANGSPIADCWPWLLALDAAVQMVSSQGERTISLKDFYTDYKQNCLLPGEMIAGMTFSIPEKTAHFRLKKISTRRDLDIATINTAFLISASDGVIERASLALGGVSKTAVLLNQTNAMLKGQKLSLTLIDAALCTMQQEISPISDTRGKSTYRRVLADNLLRDFLNEVWHGPSAARTFSANSESSP